MTDRELLELLVASMLGVLAWLVLLSVFVLSGCSAPDPLDGLEALDVSDAVQYFGAPCNPAHLTACGKLRLVEGGWCEPVSPTRAECVLPCGPTCDEVAGVCSTEGVCWRAN